MGALTTCLRVDAVSMLFLTACMVRIYSLILWPGAREDLLLCSSQLDGSESLCGKSLKFNGQFNATIHFSKETSRDKLRKPLPSIFNQESLSTIGHVDDLLVQYGDSLYQTREWDVAPIVIEKYKLIFFTIAKNGCTVWKQLFRRMMGIQNWTEQGTLSLLPWNPEINGLRYLYHYDRYNASHMMKSPEWTRAIMFRDPKERFLSAYLDKAVRHKSFLRDLCCPFTGSCFEEARNSTTGFLHLIRKCDNPHWRPQHRRMEDKYWPYINFVAHLETGAIDAERLLRRVGAWEKYGATGWGEFGNESIFQIPSGSDGRKHATDARQKLRQFVPPALEPELEEYFAGDYRHPVLNLSLTRIY